MKSAIAFALSFSTVLFFAPGLLAENPAPSAKLTARVDKPDAIYHKGETITFVVDVSENGKAVAEGEVHWTLVKDGLPLDKSGKAKVENGVAKIQGSLDEPGFVQARLSYKSNEKATPVTVMAGAAIDPTEIARSMPAPDDFDSYWAGEKEKLAAIPANPQLTSVKSPVENTEAFDVKVASVGSPVSGYFVRPTKAKAKSLPIILTVHGAGVRSSSLPGAAGWAARGFLGMDINAHGLPNGEPEQFYKDLAAGDLLDYRTRGRESRETIYFHDMFLRLVRAIDFLTEQPEWDGKNVVVYGSSQGGYQAIVAGGLDPRVTFFGAGVPAGCDHSASLVNRIAGWPKLVLIEDGKPNAASLKAAGYYDAMNFAARTKAAGAFFTVGFIDTTCPPSSVYAAYNQLTIPKGIYNDIPSGHANSPEARDAVVAAILKSVGK